MQLKELLADMTRIMPPRIVLFEELFVGSRVTLDESFVLVGCEPPQLEETLEPRHRPLLLTNKGSSRRFEIASDYRSVSALVAAAPAGLFDSWALWPSEPLHPAKMLEKITLVVEDASPDSTFGVLLFLAAAAGVSTTQFPGEWLDSIDAWERHGDCSEPSISWCALESALAHRYIPATGSVTRETMSNAWQSALRFALGFLHFRQRQRRQSGRRVAESEDGRPVQGAGWLLSAGA